MKKVILSLGLLLLSVGITFAQNKKHKDKGNTGNEKQQTVSTPPPATAAPAPQSSMKAEDMAFSVDTHDFGTVQEGPDATCEFTFKNNGKEPIIIEKAQPSCGCTVPSFSKEPVAPGASGTINVAYHTKGKPNPFNKSITVVSNAGTKILTIKGNVEKAPSGSVPENVSMIKTN